MSDAKQKAVDALRTYRNPAPDDEPPEHRFAMRSGASTRPVGIKTRKQVAADACRGIDPDPLATTI